MLAEHPTPLRFPKLRLKTMRQSVHLWLTGEAKGAVSTHRAVTTGIYAYATSLMVLRGIWNPKAGRRSIAKDAGCRALLPRHRRGPGVLNSFVIARGMVLMPNGMPASAAADREGKNHLFVGVPTMSLELMNHPTGHYDLSTLTDIARRRAAAGAHVERLRRSFTAAQPRSAMVDRDQCGRLRQFLGQLCCKARIHRPAQVPFVD